MINNKKKILVATGTSQNKLKFACDYIKNYMDTKGYDVEVVGGSIYEVDISQIKPNLIVAIGPHSFDKSIPIIMGLPFITKINMDECCEEISHSL